MEVVTGWVSAGLIAAAIVGIIGSLVYLRLRLRLALARRRAERVVVGCTAAAMIGFWLATAACLASGRCFTPQRIESSLTLVPMFVPADPYRGSSVALRP